MASIELRDITKRYPDGTEAVKQLNLEVEDGELMVLVGPSGCGKSTALRMIAGLEEISGGELTIAGEVVNERPPKDRDIAMVFQSYALYPHMTVRENLGFALKIGKVKRREIDERVGEVARVLDLTEHLDRKPANLSGGQRQRVAMGRAIVREPAAFLMDEPLSNLDAKLRVQMRAEISRIQRTLGTTTIFVTHDQTEAMTLGDRVCVLRDGILQQVGTPHDLYDRPANLFVAGFLGSPAMNLLTGEVAEDGLITGIGRIPLPRAARAALGQSGERVIVGIRPEHLCEPSGVPGEATVEVDVELVESVGSDVYVHFPLGELPRDLVEGLEVAEPHDAQDAKLIADDVRGVARLAGDTRVANGARVRLGVAPDRVHVFSVRDGRALWNAGAAAAATAA